MDHYGDAYDTKIVEMEFDNAAFEKNIHQSIDSLDDLQSKLDNMRGGTAFQQIAAAAADMGFDKVVSGIDSIDKKMSAMGVVGATVINNLTNSFLNFGRNLWSSTIGQAASGGMRRALNIQQAEFLMEGLKLDVKQLKDDAMFAVEDTAYGFDEAASAAAQFGVAGVKAGEEMKHALLGVSGVAAMTGRDYASIAHIFTTMASQGRVMGMQLTQMSYAGINAAEVLAKHLNTSAANVTKMVSQGKISFKQFSDAMYEAFGEHAKDANKTFQGNLSNIKAALSRIGAEFAGPLTTDFIPAMGELRNLINQIKKDMTPVVELFQKLTKVGNKLAQSFLESVKNSGAFHNIFEGLTNIFYAFLTVALAVSQAFKEAFPQFNGITDAFRRLTVYLIPTQEAFENIKDRAKILVWFLMKTVNKVILFMKIVSKVYILFALTFGRMAEAIVDFIAKNVDWSNTLTVITSILKFVIGLVIILASKLLWLKDKIVELFKNQTFNDFINSVAYFLAVTIGFVIRLVREAFGYVSSFVNWLVDTIKGVREAGGDMEKLKDKFGFWAPVLQKLSSLFEALGDTISELTGNIEAWHVMVVAAGIATLSFLGWIYSKYRYISKPIVDIVKNVASIPEAVRGAFTSITNTFNQLSHVLGLTELEIYSQLLLRLAISVGILTLSLLVLASVPFPKMVKGLAGLYGIVLMLAGVMGVFYMMGQQFAKGGDGSPVGDLANSAKSLTWLSGILAFLTGITTIIGILTIMAHFDPNALAQATLTMTFIIGFLTVITGLPLALKKMNLGSLSGSELLSYAGSLVITSIALAMMVGAFGLLVNSTTATPEELRKAKHIFIGLAGCLAGMLGLQKFIFKGDGKRAMQMAGAFAIMAAGIVAISVVLAQIAKVGKPKSIKAAGVAISAVILALGGATKIMEAVDILDAASFAVMASSLVLLAAGMAVLGSVNWPSVLVAAGAITLLGFAITGMMKIMNGKDAVDALAFLAIAGGISAIISSLSLLKEVDTAKILATTWSTAALVAVLVSVSAIGVEAAPVIWAVAAALLAIGAYALGIGTGIKYVSEGLTAWINALKTFADISSDVIPKIINNIKLLVIGLGDVADTVVSTAPKFVKAVLVIGKLIGMAITTAIYTIIAGILKLMLGIALFLDEHVVEILDLFNSVFTKIVDWMYEHQSDLEEAGYKLGMAIGNGFLRGVQEATSTIVAAQAFKINAEDLGKLRSSDVEERKKAYLSVASQVGANIDEGLVQPIENSAFYTAMKTLASGGIAAFASEMEIFSPSRVMKRMGGYIVEGLTNGVKDNADDFTDRMGLLADDGTYAAEKEFESETDNLARHIDNFNSSFNKVTEDNKSRAEKYAEYSSMFAKSSKDTAETVSEANEALKDTSGFDSYAQAQIDAVDDILFGTKATNEAVKSSANSYRFAALERADAIIEGAKLTKEAIEVQATSDVQSIETASEVTEEVAFNSGISIIDEFVNGLITGSSSGDAQNAVGGLFGSLSSLFGDLGTSIFGSDYSSAFKVFSGSGRDWEAEGMQILGGQYAYQRAGYDSLEKYVEAMSSMERKSTVDSWIKKFLGDFPDADDAVSELTDGLGDLSGALGTASQKTDKLSDSVKSALDVFSEFNDQVGTTGRSVLQNFMNQITGVTKWSKELEALSSRGINANFLVDLADQGPAAYDKIHALYTMTDKELALFNQMYAKKLSLQKDTVKSIRDSFVKNGAMTAKEAKEYGKTITTAAASGVTDSTDKLTKSETKALQDAADEAKRQKIDDNFIQKYTVEASYSKETLDIFNRLEELQRGGNVNLLMRPTIDTNELNKLGWDAGEGFATMFTSTFTNEEEGTAINFTPIMIDPKTGKYLGVLDPDTFDKYCQDVVEGVRKDDLNLQVGAEFTGADAFDQACAAAQEIHELHEQLGEDWGKDGFASLQAFGENINDAVKSDFISKFAKSVISNDMKLSMTQAFTDLGLASMDAFKQSMNFEVILDQLILFKNGIKEQVRSSLKLFDEVAYKTKDQKKAEEYSTQQMLYNMAENTKKIGRWATNIQKLSERGLSEGLVDQLRQLGPDGAEQIDAFVRMSDKELKKANAIYSSSLKLDEYTSDKITSAYSKAGFATTLGLKKGLKDGKDDLLFAYQEVGEDASEGFVNGVDPTAANEVMTFLGENSLSALKTALDSHSPSKETEKIGMDTTEGYILGITAPSRLAEAMSNLATTTLGMFSQMLGPDKFRIMGLECIDGFARGLIEGLQTKTRDILNMFTLSMFGINDNLEDPDNSLRVNIIPVVDQNALDGTSALMNDYFVNKRFDISASVNRANAANKTNNPDSDKNLIVDAIRGLREDIRNIKNVNEGYRTDIGSLRDAITSMKVTLDTGALVGQITNPLDAALGTKAMRSLRRRG